MKRGYSFFLADIEKKKAFLKNNKQDDTLIEIMSIIREYGNIKKIPDREIKRYITYLDDLSYDSKGQYFSCDRGYRYLFGKCTRSNRFQYNYKIQQYPFFIKCYSDLEKLISSGKYIIEGEDGKEFDLFSFRCFDYEYVHRRPMYNDPYLEAIEKLEAPSLDTPVGKLFTSNRLALPLRRKGYDTLGDFVKTSFLELWENTDLPETYYEEIKKMLYTYGLLR